MVLMTIEEKIVRCTKLAKQIINLDPFMEDYQNTRNTLTKELEDLKKEVKEEYNQDLKEKQLIQQEQRFKKDLNKW